MILLLALAQLVAGSAAMNMNGFFVRKARGADELLRPANLADPEKPDRLATRLRQCSDSAKSSPNALYERGRDSEMRIGPVPASADRRAVPAAWLPGSRVCSGHTVQRQSPRPITADLPAR
jgi:hypothetical protein